MTVDVPADLPRVRGFGGELNQIWANLIDNALDAVSDGGRVTVTARAEGPKVIVRVTDDGAGIPADVKSRIFDPVLHDEGRWARARGSASTSSGASWITTTAPSRWSRSLDERNSAWRSPCPSESVVPCEVT